MRLWLPLWLLLLGGGLGCGSARESVSPDEYALSLLNDGEYRNAARYLESLGQSDREEIRYQILIASAYAGLVGVQVVHSFDALKPLFQPDMKKTPKRKALPVELESSRDIASREAERRLMRWMLEAYQVLSTSHGIPYVAPTHRKYLRSALWALKEIPSASPDALSAGLYQILLHYVQFLNLLRDSLLPAKMNCQLDMRELGQGVAAALEQVQYSASIAQELKVNQGVLVSNSLDRIVEETADLLEYLTLNQPWFGSQNVFFLDSLCRRLE